MISTKIYLPYNNNNNNNNNKASWMGHLGTEQHPWASPTHNTKSKSNEMENFEALKDNLLATSRHNVIHLWDGGTGSTFLQLGTLLGHRTQISFVRFSLDNSKLVSVGFEDDYAIVWDLATLTELVRVSLPANSMKYAFFSNGDGAELITRDFYAIRVWDISARQVMKRSILTGTGVTSSICLSLDNSVIVAVGHDGEGNQRVLRSWDFETCDLKSEVALDGNPTRVALCPTDNNEVVVGFSDGKVRIWDLAAAVIIMEKCWGTVYMSAVWYSSCASRLVSCSFQGNYTVFNRASGALEASGALTKDVNHCVFDVTGSPDNTAVAAATDRGVIIVELLTGTTIKEIEFNNRNGSCLCWAHHTHVILL
jgi:WD40 repeat protein